MCHNDPICPTTNRRYPGIDYADFPSIDSAGYDLRNDAIGALRFIRQGLAGDEKILVHCYAGISRSSTIVLLHLMIHKGYTLDRALSHLKGVRPIIHPNRGFMQLLRETDDALQAAASHWQD